MAELTMDNLKKQLDELTKRVETIEKMKKKSLSKKLVIGDTFKMIGLRWKILDITELGYVCLAEKLESEMRFDNNSNNWKESNLREFLNNEFYENLYNEIGEENIIPFKRNLLSLDGQTEYKECEDKVSLLSVDEYRKYRTLIPNADNYWFWLLTPWSTKCNGYEMTCSVVSPSGGIRRDDCYDVCGVRPFCIFSSSIFESK